MPRWHLRSRASPIRVSRSVDDEHCIDHYADTLLDGASIPVLAEAGSTVVTIPSEELAKMSPGSHKITVRFDDGEAETTVTVESAGVPTGDEARPYLWLALMGLSATGLAAVLLANRKRLSGAK